MQVYIAGPMTGIEEFNFPTFHTAASLLRCMGHTVFSPAEKDIERHGEDISKGNKTGDVAQVVKEFGFSLRVALGEDLDWICDKADAIVMLPGWEKSNGAQAEWATARALGHEIVYAHTHNNKLVIPAFDGKFAQAS